MKAFDPDIHHRRSVRLAGYDYGCEGTYFITICIHNRECLLGDIADGAMHLNEYGRIADAIWKQTPVLRPNVGLDAYVIMPNHVHGIVLITNDGRRSATHTSVPSSPDTSRGSNVWPLTSPSQTLGSIVRGFKSAVSSRITALRNDTSPIWQRNYHEHIIRNDADLDRIRSYIANNPLRWAEDENNPARV